MKNRYVTCLATQGLIKRTMTGWSSMLMRFFKLTLIKQVELKAATPQ